METQDHSGEKIRPPVVGGIFYPEDPEALCQKLASWGLTKSPSCPGFGGQAIIAPHGAWDISGDLAAAAFAAVQPGISRVLLLGPHHSPEGEGIYLTESASFETPLGPLPVDRQLNYKLASCSALITINDIPHLSEHSLEVLLPMVKYCFDGVKIVPILVNGRRPALISALANALRMVLSECFDESLIVISNCVSRDFDEALALSMAHEFCWQLEKMDSRAFLAGLEEGCISACGGGLVAALIESGLLADKHFNSLGPLSKTKGGLGETIYYGAFRA